MRAGRPSRSRLSVHALALASLLAASSAGEASGRSSVQRGRALFTGREALRGKLRHHSSDLPPTLVACRNCHAAGRAPAPEGSRAPRLDRALLLQPRARRGGPPSAYDEASFCALLRTGIDPAHVLIAREMPVYAADAAQCRSLWRFSIERAGP
jgi:hypothetical protein